MTCVSVADKAGTMEVESTMVREVSGYKTDICGNLYHVCIALLPLLCIFNFPIINISLGTVLLIMFVPYALLYIFSCENYEKGLGLLVFMLFYGYMVFRADGSATRIILCVVSFINLWGIGCGSIKTEKLRKIIEWFALANVVLVFLQTLSHYGLHIDIHFLSQSWVHKAFRDSYAFRPSVGLYRPSALFLEPSHFAQFCCFALISVLCPTNDEKPNLIKSIAIAFGVLLTTSGMGIAVVVAVFGWYVLFSKRRIDKKITIIIGCLALAAAGIAILLQIPIFRTAFNRVFSEVDGYNAIRGRTGNWESAIGPMHGRDLWLGYGESAKFPYYLNGLQDTIFKYGIVGLLLEVGCFLYLMFRKASSYIWCCCIVFLGLFCFSHLTSVYTQIFYFGMILAECAKEIKTVTIRLGFKEE